MNYHSDEDDMIKRICDEPKFTLTVNQELAHTQLNLILNYFRYFAGNLFNFVF